MKYTSLFILLSILISCSKNSEEKEQTTPVSSVSLNLSNAEMVIGGTIQLVATISPADATEENVVWKSSNKAVASVSQSGLVTAISIGSSTITASVAGKKANCSITVKKEVDYVDLGLSVKWATKNMGAQTASDVGDYYAWGEIETRSSYDISNYKWYRDDDYTPFTKYNYKWNDYYKDGEADNIMRLELDDDVAHVKLGDLWRMPTYEEIQELVSTISDSKYKWEWKTGNGQYGWHIVYLNNGNSIFLPASGYKHGLSISQEGTDGYYWSSSLYDRSAGPYGRYGAFYAKTLHIDSEHIEGDYKARELGLAIRPVFGAIEVSSIYLNEPDLVLFEGETETLVATVLPDDATDRIITWSTSDASIATVKNGKVTALKVGQVTITAKAGDKTSTCTVTITHFPDGEYTDLGLSVKWGNQNIGAEKNSDYGEYYAWGEIDTKSDYSWSTYKWCNGSYESLTKYNTYSEYGVVDNKTKLDLSDDVAHMKLGGNWRMPTSSEIKELITTKNSSNYKWKWTSINGHNGYVIIYQGNYNSIFLPASGYWVNTSLYNDKSSGYYWSSSCGNYGSAYYISFTSEYARYTSEVVFREHGYSVRPVLDN